MKIRYQNVCLMKDEEINLEPGKLIAITGETNNGKSALYYTFVDAFTNGSNFKKWINNELLQKDSKTTAKITITDDNGDCYSAEAGTNFVRYAANSVKYEKPGRKSFFELIDGQIPGLYYDPEDSRQIMNVQDEDSGFFPIDRTDSQIFRTYERLLSLSCTEDILRTIKLDIDEIDFKISDMTSAIQQSNEQLVQIDKAISNIDETKLKQLEQQLFAAKSALLRVSAIEQQTRKDSIYVDKVKQSPQQTLEQFNVEDFKSKLMLLTESAKLEKVKQLLTLPEVERFDYMKMYEIAKALVLANTLVNDLDTLEKQISADEQRLQEVLSIINTIKVCPYCGKPME